MWAKLAFAALLLTFGWSLLDLADAAFERGDAYPPWSSLRADANGTKLLHDSFRKLPGWTVRRHFTPEARLPAEPAVILFLGQSPATLKKLTTTVERLTAGGARVLIGLPEHRQTLRKGKTSDTEAADWLGLRLEPQSSGVMVEERFFERTDWNLIPQDPAWKLTDGFAERPRGQGSILVVTGDELRNDKLRQSPNGDRLLRLLGPSHRVIFAESTLGVADQGGIVSLLRRAGWGPAALLLLAAAALYLWRAATPLLPERPDSILREEPGGGAAALSQLLRKHVPPGDLLATCLEEWKKAAGLLPRWQNNRKTELSGPPAVNTAAAYRKMQQLLREKPTL